MYDLHKGTKWNSLGDILNDLLLDLEFQIEVRSMCRNTECFIAGGAINTGTVVPTRNTINILN